MYANFEIILEPMEVELRIACEEKAYTGQINRHVSSGSCINSKFAYEDVADLLNAYRGKVCVEKFLNHIESEVKRLHSLFTEQHMVEITGTLQREYDSAT